MTRNAFKNTKQFETNSRGTANKPVVTQMLSLSELQQAAMSPKNNRPVRYETKPGSSLK